MANGDTTQELEVSKGDAKIKIRGSDWLSLAGVAVGVLMVYMLFEHKTDARDASKQFEGVVKEMVIAQKEMVYAQREQNCLLRFEQKDRTDRSEFCARVSK